MIDDGEATIHDAAGIIEADGQQSSHAIETCSGEASRDGLDDDPGPCTDPVGCATSAIDAFPSPASGVSKGSPVRFPSPESNSDHAENGGNATAPNKESNRDQDVATVKPVQIPFTRSNFPHIVITSRQAAARAFVAPGPAPTLEISGSLRAARRFCLVKVARRG